MTVHVFTHEYQASHRQHPRGFGSWAFTFRRGGQWTTEPTFYNQATYTAAKRLAMKDARATGATAISVQP